MKNIKNHHKKDVLPIARMNFGHTYNGYGLRSTRFWKI